jgi:hypothetical protein
VGGGCWELRCDAETLVLHLNIPSVTDCGNRATAAESDSAGLDFADDGGGGAGSQGETAVTATAAAAAAAADGESSRHLLVQLLADSLCAPVAAAAGEACDAAGGRAGDAEQLPLHPCPYPRRTLVVVSVEQDNTDATLAALA